LSAIRRSPAASSFYPVDGPLIDLGLEVEHEPIPGSELDLNAQRSKLCDRLLRLAAILREDLVTSFLPGHALNPGQYPSPSVSTLPGQRGL
jgi:hypothetical protein